MVLFYGKSPHTVSDYDIIRFYYIDTSVLLGNTLLVKFIRNYIRDPSGAFSISSLLMILMTSFPAFSRLFVQTVSAKRRRSDRFEKFSEADVKCFTEEQDYINTKKKTSHDKKLSKEFLASEAKRTESEEIRANELQEFAIKFVLRVFSSSFFFLSI